MVTYKEALESAKSLKRKIDYCVEYTDGFLFGWKNNDDFVGGNGGPCIILKANGNSVNVIEYYHGYDAKEIRRFDT